MKPLKPSKLFPHKFSRALRCAALASTLLLPAGLFATEEIVSTAGTFNWLCPEGVTSVQVECWGGGGAGGGSFINGGSANAGGGGGGGGAYAKLNAVPVTPGNFYPITIPPAATCPASGFTSGQRYSGSAVSFTGDGGVTVTANGGQGGGCSVVTGSTAVSGGIGAGGAAGTGYDAAWAGGSAATYSAGNGGGGGGGAGDLGAGGSPAVNTSGSFGAGGTGSDANHEGGNGGAAKNGAGTGFNAANPGGGGGGGKSTTGAPGSKAGGKGGLGKIILTYSLPAVGNLIVKTNNTDALNLTTSWVGGVTPTSVDRAVWDNTVTSANTTILGADTNWGGILVADPTGLVTINGGNTLSLGTAATNIDLSMATQDLTLNCALALAAESIWDVQTGRTLTLGGGISGTNGFTLQNAGTVILSSGANSYSGDTVVSGTSTLRLAAANVIPDGSAKGNVTVDGTLDLNTFSEAINNLSGAGTVDTVAGGTPTLTVGANSPYANTPFSGVIQNTAGSLSLTKTGTNLVALSGINTFSGAVQLNEGYLAVGAVSAITDVLPNVSGITIADGATLAAWTNTTLTKPIIVASGGTAAIAAPINPITSGSTTLAKTFSLEGGISGNGNVVFEGVNAYNWYGHILVANCTYTGSTLMTCSDDLTGSLGFPASNTNNNNIIVRLAGDNGLPTTTVLTMDGNAGVGGGRFCDFNLNGNNQTLAGLLNVPRSLRNQRVLNPDTLVSVALTISNSVDYAFSGQLGGSGGSLSSGTGNNFSLTKSGSGTFTLSRAAGNTYANGTTIGGGTLLVNNTSNSGTGPGDVAVNSGGTLAGTGTIAGNVTVGIGGTLAPGSSTGTLTINGNLVMDSASTNIFEVDGSTSINDSIALGATVTYGGVLKIVPSGSFTNGQTFTLFSGPGATDPSNFGSVVVTPAVGDTSFTFTNGVLTAAVVTVGPSGPATLTNNATGGTLSLSWPADQGWRLQMQTNSLAIGLFTNWTYITDGSISSTNITIDATKPAVFYRLTYP